MKAVVGVGCQCQFNIPRFGHEFPALGRASPILLVIVRSAFKLFFALLSPSRSPIVIVLELALVLEFANLRRRLFSRCHQRSVERMGARESHRSLAHESEKTSVSSVRASLRRPCSISFKGTGPTKNIVRSDRYGRGNVRSIQARFFGSSRPEFEPIPRAKGRLVHLPFLFGPILGRWPPLSLLSALAHSRSSVSAC
jgi:hypothetical protein